MKGDRDQCLRVFNNVLKNAVQSLDDVEDPLIEIRAEKYNSVVHIIIHDNGCGIPEELQPKIFTPNFTTKSTGTGFGLTMVKNSVLAFNGAMSFETKIDEGTTFTLTFPLVDEI